MPVRCVCACLCVCVFLCMSMCTEVQVPVEMRGTDLHGAEVTRGCKPPNMDTRHQTLVFCKRSIHSSPLSHLLAPNLDFFSSFTRSLSLVHINFTESLLNSWLVSWSRFQNATCFLIFTDPQCALNIHSGQLWGRESLTALHRVNGNLASCLGFSLWTQNHYNYLQLLSLVLSII